MGSPEDIKSVTRQQLERNSEMELTDLNKVYCNKVVRLGGEYPPDI